MLDPKRVVITVLVTILVFTVASVLYDMQNNTNNSITGNAISVNTNAPAQTAGTTTGTTTTSSGTTPRLSSAARTALGVPPEAIGSLAKTPVEGVIHNIREIDGLEPAIDVAYKRDTELALLAAFYVMPKCMTLGYKTVDGVCNGRCDTVARSACGTTSSLLADLITELTTYQIIQTTSIPKFDAKYLELKNDYISSIKTDAATVYQCCYFQNGTMPRALPTATASSTTTGLKVVIPSANTPGGTCIAGAKCSDGQACSSSGLCPTTLGKACATVGAECAPSINCGTDNYCGGAGAACTATAQCASQQCASGKCTSVQSQILAQSSSSLLTQGTTTDTSGQQVLLQLQQ